VRRFRFFCNFFNSLVSVIDLGQLCTGHVGPSCASRKKTARSTRHHLLFHKSASLPKAGIHNHSIPLRATEQILNIDIIIEPLLRLPIGAIAKRRLLLVLGPAVRHAAHIILLVGRSRSHLSTAVETHIVLRETGWRRVALVAAGLLEVGWQGEELGFHVVVAAVAGG
jgi:hypothetical protein